jgi:hypothetical protein
MTTRALEDSLPYVSGTQYPYTREGQMRLAEDCRHTVVALTRANAEAIEAMDAAMADGDVVAARKALDSQRTLRLGSALQRLGEALRWLEHDSQKIC